MLLRDGADESVFSVYRTTVDRHDEVAADSKFCVADDYSFTRAANACRSFRTVGRYRLDQETAATGQTECFGEIACDVFRGDAGARTFGDAPGFEVTEQSFGAVDGQRKPDTEICLTHDGGIEADDVTGGIEQRTAAVAAVDGRIGLNHAFDALVFFAFDGAADGADNPGSQRSFQAEGISDGQHFLSHLQMIGVTQAERGKLLLRD